MKPHYDKIRKVKTGSGSTAIQVGVYCGKRFKLIKHIGSSKNPNKINELIEIAKELVRVRSPQLEFNFNPQSEEILFKRGLKVEKSCLQNAYEYLDAIYARIGFNKLENEILKHFSMMRVLEPASKAKSIILLNKYFDIDYKKTTVFRKLLELIDLKSEVEKIAIKYAKDNLRFDFSLVFYDVTTLYFETHTQDDFRRNGFSKDNKINQPQILIGLVVNDIGFPIYYEIFKGNTFEGKTIIPVILKIKEKYQIERFTVVADAGMLSADNLTALETNGIDYVVGARIGSLNINEVRSIASKLNKQDKAVVRRENIIYEYSAKRAGKDRIDNDKQIEKAKYYLNNPGKVMKRSKFLSNLDKKSFKLNTAMFEKYRLLEGIKGYKTNINKLSDNLLINRYKDLWRVEQSFRIAKSDLAARPIYHRKQSLIECHVLIVFAALCMGRVIELDKKESIKKVTEDLKNQWTITLTDDISGNSLKILLDKKPH